MQPPPSYLGQDKPTSDRPALHPSHSLSLLSTSCPPSSALPTSPYPPLPALTPHPTPHDHKLTTLPRGPVGYCPSVSPVHQSLVVSVPSPAVRARLAQLQQSRSLRQMAEKVTSAHVEVFLMFLFSVSLTSLPPTLALLGLPPSLPPFLQGSRGFGRGDKIPRVTTEQ